jgi:hypothetical protein
MNQFPSTPMLSILLALLTGLGLSSCIAYDQPYGPGYAHTPPPPSVVFYSYWYYPDIQVYFDSNRQVYFYYSNNHWLQARVLPPPLRAHMGGYVHIQSRYNQPYIEHNEHSRKYPPHYREVYRPPQQHDDHYAPPGHSIPPSYNNYQKPFKQPPTVITKEPHAQPLAKDKDKTKDKKTNKTKDANGRYDQAKPKAPFKKKDEQSDQDKDQRDSR